MSRVCWNSFLTRYFEASATAESEPEVLFQMLMRRLLHPDATFQPQFPYKTRRGSYRADFLLITSFGERLTIEIDGKEFHDPVRDQFRDAFTLADEIVQHVYRFSAQTIFQSIWHAVYAIHRHHPGVFTPEAVDEIRDKASRFVPSHELLYWSQPQKPESIIVNPVWEHPTSMTPSSEVIVRSGINKRGAPLFGVDLIDFARANPGKDIDWLTAEWKERFVTPLMRGWERDLAEWEGFDSIWGESDDQDHRDPFFG